MASNTKINKNKKANKVSKILKRRSKKVEKRIAKRRESDTTVIM